jgi:uncharacterized membrane protein YfcA
MALLILLTGLVLGSLVFLFTYFRNRARPLKLPSLEALLLGLIANFFDTLGIGSFAPTTAYFKFRKLVSDDLIPPSLLVGFAIPTAVEALAFISSVQVDPDLLAGSILLAIIGALLGSLLVERIPIQLIRLSLGAGLLVAALIFALSNLGLMPAGGTATSLETVRFGAALAISFALGVLMNVGIGNYGPQLISLSLLGLDPRAAFPIMMGSSAFLMLATSIRLIARRPLNQSLLIGMTVGGVPGVLVAAFIVKSLPIEALRWGVVIVATYAALLMITSAVRSNRTVRQNDPVS